MWVFAPHAAAECEVNVTWALCRSNSATSVPSLIQYYLTNLRLSLEIVSACNGRTNVWNIIRADFAANLIQVPASEVDLFRCSS